MTLRALFLILQICQPLSVSSAGDPEAVYAWWDDVNKQHTFHFPPEWTHGDTKEKQGDIAFYAYWNWEEGTEAVYDWWDDANKQHTFHMEPGWKDEKRGDVTTFYAFKEHAPNTHPVYAFWDNVNKQHTFHLVPEWKHGETMETKGDLMFFAYDSATPHKKAELKNVYDFWDDKNKQHTFHFAPAWSHSGVAERQGRAQFLAYDAHHEGTEPVFDFWHEGNSQHTFHFGPASDGEEMRGVQYYAYKEDPGDVADLIAIHMFWDTVNKQNTYHAPPAWPNEEEVGVAMYAFAPTDDTVQPVYAFWDDVNKQHTFHFPPAWKHGDHVETQGGVVFSAYSGQFEGTEPVWDWWDDNAKQHTFHFEPAWEGEVKGKEAQFYAFPEKSNPLLVAVYDFWDTVNKQHTFHFPPAWKNEEQRAIQFYTYANETDGVWKPPTPAPTDPTPPAAAKFLFTSDSPDDLIGNADFLTKCTEALKASGKDARCVGVKEGNEGGVEIEVAGDQAAIDELDTVGGWDGVDLPEVTRLAPTGAKNPTVGIETENNTVAAAVRPGHTLMYIGASSVVMVAQVA